MKNILLLIVLTIGLNSYANKFAIPEDVYIENKEIIDYVLQKECALEFIEMVYFREDILIDYETKMYVISDNEIKSIMILGSGDWMYVHNLKPANNLEYNCNAFISFVKDNNGYEVIELKADNGDVFYCYPQDHFYDNKICAEVYYNDDFELIIGEDYIIYENSLDTWRYNRVEFLTMWE